MAEESLQIRRGPMSGRSLIGEVTEAVHKHLLDRYDLSDQAPRFEENLDFVPKDREQVVYIYMYRIAQIDALKNSGRWRLAPVFLANEPTDGSEVFYHRPPLMLDLFYLVSAHAKFRSEGERLLGWVLLALEEATHLLYRPRKFILPDGRAVDSLGRDYDPEVRDGDERLFMEKVSLSLVDDLSVGDAIHFYTIHNAPYRPFLTYRARIALDGPLVASAGGATIKMGELQHGSAADPAPVATTSPNGRMRPAPPTEKPAHLPGPKAHNLKRRSDKPD